MPLIGRLTINSEHDGAAEPLCDHVPGPTGVVTHVGQVCLADQQVTRVRYDVVLQVFHIYLYSIFQPINLHREVMHLRFKVI